MSEVVAELTLNSLPNEILLKIFTYLEIEDICFAVSKVCERWNYITQDVNLWRNFNFICKKEMSLGYISSLLTEMPLLKSIKLQWRTDVELIFHQLCNSCEDVRKVELVCCGQMKETSMQLLVDHFPDLEVFSMGKCWSVDPNCFNLVCKFSNLRKVNLSHSRMLDGLILREIIDASCLLQHINLDYVRELSDDDVIYLLESRKNNLLSLVLYGERLTDTTYCYMEVCRTLRSLHLSSCILMTDRGLKSIAKLNSLRQLKLRKGVNLSAGALKKFILCNVASNLECLILSRLPNMNDSVACNIPINCVNLRSLELVYCPHITDITRECFVTGCKNLEVLCFRKNGSAERDSADN